MAQRTSPAVKSVKVAGSLTQIPVPGVCSNSGLQALRPLCTWTILCHSLSLQDSGQGLSLDRRLWSGLGHAMSCCWLHSTGFSLRVRAPTELGVLRCADSSPHACAVTLRYEAPNGPTQSQSQPTTSLQGPSHGGSTSLRCRGRRGCRLDVSGQPVTGGPSGNQEDGRMGTPTGCCWQAAHWDSNHTHGLQTQPSAPRRHPLVHGAWCGSPRRGSTWPLHPLSLNAWAKTRDGFQDVGLASGQPSGGCLFEQRL